MDASEEEVKRQLQAEQRWGAAENTLLIWVRTCLGLMGFGFVVARFGLFLGELSAMGQVRVKHNPTGSVFSGTALIVLGVVFLLLAVVAHRRLLGRIQRGEPQVLPGWSLGMVLCIIVAGLGMILAVSLAIIS